MASSGPPSSNGTASPSMGEIMANAQIVSEETMATILIIQGLIFIISILVALPSLYTQILSGRFKEGWTWTTHTNTTAKSNMDSTILQARLNQKKVQRFNEVLKALVPLRQYCNAAFLRVIPLLNLTVGQFLVLFMIFGLFLYGLLCGNMEAPASNFQRPGFVAATFLPLSFICAMKNTPFAIIGKGYERVNFIHRFVSRLLIISAVLHGALWLRMKLASGKTIHFSSTSTTGLVALSALTIILLSSLKPFRLRFYQTFLGLHVLGYFTALVALYMHVPALFPFIFVSIAAIVVDTVLVYVINTRVRSALVTALPGQMVKVEVDQMGDGWRAGQHVYLRLMRGGSVFQKHPFTIANASASNSAITHRNTLILVVRAVGDFTKILYATALEEVVQFPLSNDKEEFEVGKMDLKFAESQNIKRQIPVTIEGPYGRCYTDMCQHDVAVLIAGGSGFTFVSGMLEEIIGSVLRGKAAAQTIYLIWTLRDLDMTQAFASTLNKILEVGWKAGLEIIFQIHITTHFTATNYVLPKYAELKHGRIDMPNLMEEVLSHTEMKLKRQGLETGCGVGVGVCGPGSLISSVRNAVGNVDNELASWVGGIHLQSEHF